jgi:REP element-mobilizing transposase RayT
MPRKPRFVEPLAVYHLISRFVDRDWFIKRELEREMYLQLLGRALTESDWKCLSYAVMSNHIHNCLIAGTRRLDSWLRRVHSPFADSLNREFKRIGCVFVRGPKQLFVAPADVGRVIAYVHNNPVRAGVVGEPAASTWTSHRAYVGAADVPPWLHVSLGKQHLDVADVDGFVRNESSSDPSSFEQRYDALVAEPETTERTPRVQHVLPQMIVDAVASELEITGTQLCSPRRGSVELLGRTLVARCGIDFGLTTVALASVLGVTQQAVSVMQRREETLQMREMRERVVKRIA